VTLAASPYKKGTNTLWSVFFSCSVFLNAVFAVMSSLQIFLFELIDVQLYVLGYWMARR